MLELLKDLWDFMRERKKLWLAPLVILLLLIGLLVIVSQHSVVGSLIYTLF
jgi:cytochrome c-type biogenesis protein CcmH/NrfF